MLQVAEVSVVRFCTGWMMMRRRNVDNIVVKLGRYINPFFVTFGFCLYVVHIIYQKSSIDRVTYRFFIQAKHVGLMGKEVVGLIVTGWGKMCRQI